MVLLLNVGCKKSENLIFEEKPEIRMEKAVEQVNSLLNSSPNGWIVTLSALDGGGYGFYMDFDGKSHTVKMLGDLTNQSATGIKSSTYVIKKDMGPMLSFDTYNYISILQDSDQSVFGGAYGTGFKSDIEFIYEYDKADTLVLKGKRYRQNLVMVKATAAQKALYESQAYGAAITRFNDFFNGVNGYFELVKNGTTLKVGVEVNTTNDMVTGKRLSFTGVLADGKTVETAKAKFAYTIDGAEILNGGIVWQGINFVRISWINATTLAVYDFKGNEYVLKKAIQPLLPLYMLWGTKYSTMLSEHKTYYPGTSIAGQNILKTYYDNVNVKALTANSSFDVGKLTFKWDIVNKRLTLTANLVQSWTTNTAGYNSVIVYNYTGNENNEYVFTKYSGPSGTYPVNIITGVDAAILAHKFKFEYHEDAGVVYAKMTSIDDPSIVMTFKLQ